MQPKKQPDEEQPAEQPAEQAEQLPEVSPFYAWVGVLEDGRGQPDVLAAIAAHWTNRPDGWL